MKLNKYFLFFLPVIACFFLIINCRGIQDNKQEGAIEPRIENKDDTLHFVFAGDIMGHLSQQKAAYNFQTGKYSFTECYQFIRPYIVSADFAIANLEIPLAGKPYSGYPHFSAPDELFEGALNAGFDAIQLANNHAADKGKIGLSRTFNTVNKKIPTVGIYMSEDQRDSIYPLIVKVKDLKVAFLNCTYSTNGNFVAKPYIVNLIDTAQIRKDVETARQRGAKCLIMTIHWGTEYKLGADSTQKNLAHFFADLDIDAIIGSHPHVVQNFEWIARKRKPSVPVFYSLGNMISNQRWKNSNGGILAELQLSRSTGKILSAKYLPFYVHKGIINGKFQYYLIPTKKYLNKRFDFQLPPKEENKLAVFDKTVGKRLTNIESWE